MVRMGPSPGEEPNPQGWGRALALHHDAPRQLSCTLLPSPVVLGMLLAEFAWGWGGSVVHGPTDGWFCDLAGSLSAFVYQHAITPLALPCKLCIPTRGKPPRHGVLREEGGGPLF